MAMATLTIDMVAKLANLERDMGKASRIAEQNAKKMEKAFSAAGKALAAIGAGFSVGAFVSMTRNVADSADAMAKLSQRTGVAVTDLSKLEYAASLNDATLGDLERGLKGISNKMLEASKGGNDAAAAFAALGIKVTDSSGKLRPVRAVLDDVADAFAGMEDGAGKAAIANKLMEKSGLRLIPTLNNGSAGLRAMGYEAERLGIVMSADLARASVEFNDNLTRMDALGRAVGIRIGNELIPILNDLASQFLDAQQAGLGFFEALTRNGSPLLSVAENLAIVEQQIAKIEGRSKNFLTDNLEKAGVLQGEEALEKLRRQRDYLQLQIDRGNKSLAQQAGIGSIANRRAAPKLPSTSSKKSSSGKKAKEDDPLADALADIEARIKPAEQAIERFRQVQLDAAVSGAELTKSERLFYDLINDPAWSAMPEPWQDLARAQFESANAAEKAAAEQDRLNALLAATPTQQLEKQRETMQFLAEAYERGRINAEQFGEAANAALGNVAPAAEEAGGAMSEYSKQAARNMQDAFADFLFDPFDKGLKGMAESFGKTLQRMAADATAAAIFDAITGKKTGSKDTGASAVSFFSAIASFFEDGGIMTNAGPLPLRKYASGGVANSAQLAMFGEGDTPEAYVPLPDGRSIPVTMKGAGGGGVVLNQTFNFQGQADPQQVRMAAGSGARQALGAMNGARRYG